MKFQLAAFAATAGLLSVCGTTSAADGKAVYEATCAACHASGAAGAPRLDDKAAWEPRLKDVAALNTAAIKGKGLMPPKGGNAGLSDADVTAAVTYMVSQSK